MGQNIAENSRILLKHLKIYHQSAITSLNKKIREQMLKFNTWTDSRKSLRKIQRNGKKIRHAYDQRRITNWNDWSKNLIKKENVEETLIDHHKLTNLYNIQVRLLNSLKKSSLLRRSVYFPGVSCPRPPCVNRFELRQDFLDFACRLRLREYFHDQEDLSNNINNHFQ